MLTHGVPIRENGGILPPRQNPWVSREDVRPFKDAPMYKKRCGNYWHHKWAGEWGDCVRCGMAQIGTVKRTVHDFWAKVEVGEKDECWTWRAAVDHCGYGIFHWGGRYRLAHCVSWEFANGRKVKYSRFITPKSECVIHSCDNRLCVNPAHLRMATQKENLHDMIRRGRSGTAKLTPAQVIEARRLYSEGHTQADLVRRFHIRQSTMCKLVHGKIWKAVV